MAKSYEDLARSPEVSTSLLTCDNLLPRARLNEGRCERKLVYEQSDLRDVADPPAGLAAPVVSIFVHGDDAIVSQHTRSPRKAIHSKTLMT